MNNEYRTKNAARPNDRLAAVNLFRSGGNDEGLFDQHSSRSNQIHKYKAKMTTNAKGGNHVKYHHNPRGIPAPLFF